MKLEKEVFSTPTFAAYAEKNLVLVQVDFPQRKKQSSALKRANEALQKKFAVDGFPTLVLLDSEGKKLGEKVGYEPGSGPKSLIAELEKLRNP